MPFVVKLKRLVLKPEATFGEVNRWIDGVMTKIETALKLSHTGGISITDTPTGKVISLDLPESFWIQLTGAADATKGGYPWVEVVQKPALYIIDRGSKYSTCTLALTGDGTSPTATVGVNENGTLQDPVVTDPGSGNTTLSILATGDGSGATFGYQLNEGALEGNAWVATPRTGGTNDLAYEVRNNRALSAGPVAYLAMRNPETGRLLFFSRATIEAVTTVKTSYPTTAAAYYAMNPIAVGGKEEEGAAATIATSSVLFYALNLGGSVPPQGTQVKCAFTGTRFVFRF